jgi:HSP20 family protein
MTALLPSLRRRGLVGRPGWSFFDRFFEDVGWPLVFTQERAWAPPVDISETEDELVLRLEVPGMDRKDINITVSEGVLTVAGEKKMEREEKETCHCTERCYGSFSRSLCLPFDVETDDIDATFKDGVLKITLPRAEASKPKRIEVKS